MIACHFRFDVKIAAAVAQETGLPFVTAENKFEALVSILPLTNTLPSVFLGHDLWNYLSMFELLIIDLELWSPCPLMKYWKHAILQFCHRPRYSRLYQRLYWGKKTQNCGPVKISTACSSGLRFLKTEPGLLFNDGIQG